MAKVWFKRILMAGGAIAIAGAFAYALQEKPSLADMATISPAPMKVTILQEAQTRVRDVYTVSAPISGNLDRINIEEGADVVAGKTIVAAIRPLDPPLIDKRSRAELLAARDASKASVAIARVDLERAVTAREQAQSDMERAHRLANTNIIADSTLQKAKTALDDAKARVESAKAAISLREAELATAEARLIEPDSSNNGDPSSCCVSIAAPVDGVVLNIFAKSEQPVQAGMKIAEIGDPRKLEIVAGLLSTDAVKIKAGTPAEIVNWGGEPLSATVRRVDPAAFTKISALGIEEQRVNAVLDLNDTDPRLGHGFRVYAELAVWQSDAVLQVPIAALFRNGNDWNVFKVVDGRAVQTSISIDHMNNTAAEIVSGLNEGDVVILYPSDTLADGAMVEQRAQ